MPNFNAECIVLKSSNYKESDKIYTLYSKDYGKFIATARGVRKISSKRGGNLDTLNHVVVGISESEKGYKYISEVQSSNTFRNLKNSLEMSAKGFYLAELVHKLTEEEQQGQDIFDLLLKTLRLLDSGVMDPMLAISYFEISLMRILGYGLTLDSCIECSKALDETWDGCKINFGLGGLVCTQCSSMGIVLSVGEARFLKSMNKGKIFPDLHEYSRPVDLIKMHVRDVLDGATKTVQVFGNI